MEKELLNLDTFGDHDVQGELNDIFSKKMRKAPSLPIFRPAKKMSSFCKKPKECKITADVSDEESAGEQPEPEQLKIVETPKVAKPQKKRRKRRDVIFKKILRECRRFFQTKLTDLTGFIASKKPRKDDYMYACMRRFNVESLNKEGTFEENFYLACLLYPQDLARNLDSFISKSHDCNYEAMKKMYKGIIHKIHDTLYKYSHDKLDFFVSKPELASLFCYFYREGAGEDRTDPKYVEEYEFIKNKCFDSLNRFSTEH